MPGRGDGKRNGSEERNWGSQCFSAPNEMRQPRDALLLTPQGSETELHLRSEDFVASLQYGYSNDRSDLLWYLLVRQDPIGHEHRKVLLFANPSIPLVGMGRPTTSLSLRPGPNAPRGILSLFVGLVHARANEHWPQQQGTMTNRVRDLATSARKRNVVLVEAFFPLLVKGARDVRGVRASFTNKDHHRTGRSWADPAPKHKG
ncbi:hypothetical protein RIF29_45496 [Crotalaria pallida]|uniref:Uncharacterized protein n=1 Tax=Crotalaria pallida TaxID=3830 RepID=A0AAN9E091_CROPI